jgi:hypothetical protein
MIKMKKNLLYLCALTLLSGIFTGCSKDDDTEAPVVTILGDNPYKLAVGSVFNATNDPGATVSDNEDGDISDDLVPDYSELNLNVAGEYEVHYEIADKAGNIGDEHRLMYVTHTGAQIDGNTWTISETLNGAATAPFFNTSIVGSNIYAFSLTGICDDNVDNPACTAIMEADRVTIPEANAISGTSSFKVAGSGTIEKLSNGKLQFTLTYTYKDVTTGVIETYNATVTSL